MVWAEPIRLRGHRCRKVVCDNNALYTADCRERRPFRRHFVEYPTTRPISDLQRPLSPFPSELASTSRTTLTTANVSVPRGTGHEGSIHSVIEKLLHVFLNQLFDQFVDILVRHVGFLQDF